MKKNYYFGLIVLVAILSSSCRKNDGKAKISDKDASAESNLPPEPIDELTADSVYLYAKDVYYWNKNLPTYDVFKPRETLDLNKLLAKIKSFSPIHPESGKHLDKYTAFDNGQARAQVIDATKINTYGFFLKYRRKDDLRITYVYKGTSAGDAGIKRGFKVLAINGNDQIQLKADGSPAEFIMQALAESVQNIKLKLQRYDGTIFEASLTKALTKPNPVLYSNIITLKTGKKAGYLVFSSFISNSQIGIFNELAKFHYGGCEDLIIDLRNNGGGAIDVATKFASHILPEGVPNLTPMGYLLFNETMQKKEAFILKHQITSGYSLFIGDYSIKANSFSFYKNKNLGSFSPKNLIFLVNEGTASASELLISAVAPYYSKVQLIGNKTYGKPFGFSPMKIGKYDVYYTMFELKSENFNTDYSEGLKPTLEINDEAISDWGSDQDLVLKAGLSYLETSQLPSSTRSVASDNRVQRANKLMAEKGNEIKKIIIESPTKN